MAHATSPLHSARAWPIAHALYRALSWLASEPTASWPYLWLKKMSGTSVKIIKNEVGCRDDAMPKTVETRKALRGGLRVCNNLPQPHPYILVFGGCGRLLHALNPPCSAFLVSTVFGMASSLHPTSFLMIFTLVSHSVVAYTYYTSCTISVCGLNLG